MCEKVEYWEKRYRENEIGWHMDAVHPNLVKYLNELIGDENVKKKFFVPLCGKTKDIPYLLSLGHEVFGIDGVHEVIQELDEENYLNLKFDEKNSIYQTEDGKLKIYLGDFFQCPIEKWGPFDCIWDRGSFIAMDYSARSAYIKIMQRSVGINPENISGNKIHDFKYLLQTVRYDKSAFEGPPKSVDETDIKAFFESWTEVTNIDDRPVRNDPNDVYSYFHQSFYIIKNKK